MYTVSGEQTLGTLIAVGVDPAAASFGSCQTSAQIGQDDHRKFETLSLVNVDDAYTVCLLLEDRRLGTLAGTGFLFQPADEGAEGKCSAGVGLPGKLGDAVEIGQTARAASVEGHGGVGSDGVQSVADRFGNGQMVALAVQFAENREGLPDRLEFWVGILGRIERSQTMYLSLPPRRSACLFRGS